MTDTKGKEDKDRLVTVSVPVTVTILVPVDVSLSVDDSLLEHNEQLGVNLVDATQCEEAANAALIAADADTTVNKAFNGMVSAAMRFKEAFPEVDVCATPFAGLVPETRV